MIQVSYISSSTRPMSVEDLKSLLAECRAYNREHGITGMLLYYNSTFMQVLEGEEDEIDSLIERIRKDSRHTEVKLIDRRSIEQREYGDWSMGLKVLSGDQLSKIPELRDFSERDFNTLFLEKNASLVQSLMNHFRRERLRALGQEELSLSDPDPLINALHRIIRHMVRVVAVLMVFTIFWGVIDVIYVMYTRVVHPAIEEYAVRDIIITFGAFLTVLIAIEIFMNITLYLRDDVIHIRLVIVTALMAIARKVIILDFEKVEPMYMFATATIVIALGGAYWLVGGKTTLGRLTRQTE